MSDRYSRQIVIDEIGQEGQSKLGDAKVLVVGAGGLGSPALMYLAGAGVGNIGIIDADCVSESNLNRQVIHNVDNIGKNKALSAGEGVLRLNDKINVTTYPIYLTKENAADIISKYDFVLDCVDNFEGKFLINDECVRLKKPFCHAGVIRFNGQVLTYVPGRGPCYRCIFEDIPKEGDIPDNAKVGVIGAATGIVGSVQAMEAIKYILGTGNLLTGKMFIIDALTMDVRIAKFGKSNPECGACGNMLWL